MLKEGHFGLSLLLVAPVAALISVTVSPVVAVVISIAAIVGSGLPDLDTKTSIVKHRGWTHTVWFSGVSVLFGVGVFGLFLYLFPLDTIVSISSRVKIVGVVVFGLGVGFGVLTHLVGDAITPRGIRPFAPALPRDALSVSVPDTKYRYEVANASNNILNQGMLGLGILAMCGAMYISSFAL